MSTLLTTLQSMSKLEEMKDVGNAEYFDMKQLNSTFLDIGSGFGKPVFHAAM